MRALVVVLLILTGCDASAQTPVLRPILTIGCESCDGPSLFSSIQAISVSPSGNIVVVDQTDPRIRVFDREGNAVSAYGRTGSGPGELQFATGVSIDSIDTIHVVDMAQMRLMSFDKGGELVRSIRVSGFPSTVSFPPYGSSPILSISLPRDTMFRVFQWHGDSLGALTGVGVREFPDRRGNIEALSLAASRDGSFVVGDGAGTYKLIRFTGSGQQSAVITRDVSKHRFTEEEAAEVLARRERMQQRISARFGRAVRPGRAVAPTERNYFNAGMVKYDENSVLWIKVERGLVSTSTFDLFAPAGEFLGSVAIAGNVSRFALGGGRLVAVVDDELGVQRVAVWAVKY